MVKKSSIKACVVYVFSLLAISTLLYYLYNLYFPLREGVVFTPYDNAKWFNKPWDQFCVQMPPSCQNTETSRLASGNPHIGCWCNNKKQAPLLDNNCTDLEFDPFIEYR